MTFGCTWSLFRLLGERRAKLARMSQKLLPEGSPTGHSACGALRASVTWSVYVWGSSDNLLIC